MHEHDRKYLALRRGKKIDDAEPIAKAATVIGDITDTADGGEGSGNHGHKGRPGQRGGSGGGGSGGGSENKKESPKSNTSEFGELVTTYKDGTKGYEKKDVDLTPEEHKQWMGAMDSWVKAEAMNELAKNGYKRKDVDITINRDNGTATIKTWRDDPKSPSGISNDYFDVKLKGTRTTNVKPDGRTRTWVSPQSVKLIYRGSEQY